ncbi:phage portal protein [Thalassospira sp.]|uniref:phage portal protein n=1 Tax=Thalassospira sp. TaxID=1912094 RepID=UPI001B24C595|nr:phage portal protein [Thalassospira sp.]MBO6805738.1 phage portal protein [Thalassospira sp.]MBO6841352.1 phage portal protein [Thalassospira sp.]
MAKATKSRAPSPAKQSKVEAFSFGDPEPVLNQRDVMSYFHSSFNGSYYEPPISFDGLAKSLPSNPHHESAIRFKVNQLAAHFMPSKFLKRHEFTRLATDYLVFGNLFAEQRFSRLGGLLEVTTSLARWTRAKKDGRFIMLIDGKEHEYPEGAIIHLQEPDINQEIYGLPTYTAALQSAWLNEAATLFRRKYYLNGSHAGFILYINDAAANPEDVDAIREAMKNAKGPGNFRNLFYYSPNGKKDGIQIMPMSEVAAKDEFSNMKNVTRDDVLAAHRVPPQLLGIVPVNAGGFGSIQDAAEVFHNNEIRPIMAALEGLNDLIGQQVVSFKDYLGKVKDD